MSNYGSAGRVQDGYPGAALHRTLLHWNNTVIVHDEGLQVFTVFEGHVLGQTLASEQMIEMGGALGAAQ
jgi:hypothetical protein